MELLSFLNILLLMHWICGPSWTNALQLVTSPVHRVRDAGRVHSLAPPLSSRSVLSRLNMALSPTDLKNGMTVEIDNAPHKIQDCQRVKCARESAFVRAKIKNLISGTTREKTFRGSESIKEAMIERKDAEFIYMKGNKAFFTDVETKERVTVDQGIITQSEFLIEGLTCSVVLWNDRVIDVVLPTNGQYVVVETAPVIKTHSSQGGTKPAKLNSGATIQVPNYVDVGQTIIVSIDECRFVSRANSQSF